MMNTAKANKNTVEKSLSEWEIEWAIWKFVDTV